jgi:FixJ family two-component response regulator
MAMENGYTVFVVDDDKVMRLLFESMLSQKYSVEVFSSAESCLNRLEHKQPDLFLLDVSLPGMDGYDLCRNIKSVPEIMRIPVVFISGRDDIEAIMAGYDAGAEEYIVKPFDIVGLSRKIENLQRIERDRKALLDQAKASDGLTTLVMSNLSESSVLIGFLRALNGCQSSRDVVNQLLHVLDAFKLDGAVQIRMRDAVQTFSRSGEDWPLETAVIDHVRSMGRIFEFRKRAAYNFEHITLLLANMPLHDPDRCGRIRDNIAIAAESAEAKLVALQAFDDNVKMRDEISSLLRSVSQTVQSFGEQYDQTKRQGAVYTGHIIEDLLGEFAHLGMSAHQENLILKMVEDRSNSLINIYQTLLDRQKQVLDVLAKSQAGSHAGYPVAPLRDEANPDRSDQTGGSSDTTFF